MNASTTEQTTTASTTNDLPDSYSVAVAVTAPDTPANGPDSQKKAAKESPTNVPVYKSRYQLS